MALQTGLPAPWKPGDPIESVRLNQWLAACVFNVRVQNNTPLTIVRNGNDVVIGFKNDLSSGRKDGILRVDDGYGRKGMYVVRLQLPTTAQIVTSGTDPIAAGDMGSDGVEAVGIHLEELDPEESAIDTARPDIYFSYVWGGIADNGLPIVYFNGTQGDDCDPGGG
jgi:hypothetical protein